MRRIRKVLSMLLALAMLVMVIGPAGIAAEVTPGTSTTQPTEAPSERPTSAPSEAPSGAPSEAPTVAPVEVTVTPDDEKNTKKFGEKDPELTAKVEGVRDGDTIEYKLVREEGENIGEYKISFVNPKTEQGN